MLAAAYLLSSSGPTYYCKYAGAYVCVDHELGSINSRKRGRMGVGGFMDAKNQIRPESTVKGR